MTAPHTAGSPVRRATAVAGVLIRRALHDSSRRLPRLTDMAAAAGVSHVTMLRALRPYKDARLIHSRRGSGFSVADTTQPSDIAHIERAYGSPPGERPQRNSISARLTPRIRDDILRGVFRSNAPLPRPKELLRRYRVNYRTLRRALTALVETGLLEKEGRGYRTASFSSPAPDAAIVLVARGRPSGGLYPLSPRTTGNLRFLENACAAAGVRLIVTEVNDNGIGTVSGDGHHVPLEHIVREHAVIGFIVWTMGLTVYDPRGIIRHLYMFDKPLAVFDEGDDIDLPTLRRSRCAPRRFYLAASLHAGRQTARHLIQLGHRRLAYISANHDSLYSRRRLAGARQECEAWGHSVRLRRYCCDEGSAEGPRPDWDAMREEYLHCLVERGWLGDAGQREAYPEVKLRAARGLRSIQTAQRLRDRLYPLLEQALRSRDTTAWIAANDETAIECLDFLHNNGQRVPTDISVTGFDNSPDATLAGLTSYDFNAQAYMHAMVNHILDPGYGHWIARRDGPMEINGFVNARTSTGPPPRTTTG